MNKNNQTSTNNKKIHTIKEIKHIEEEMSEPKFLTAASAGITGYFGLAAMNVITTEGFSALSNYPGGIGLGVISSSLLLFALTIYIPEKIKANKEIQELRKENNLSKEKQKEILEKLVLEGDIQGTELFDYFYGERKRKKIR